MCFTSLHALQILKENWQSWQKKEGISVQFAFAKNWFPWSSSGRVCGELSKEEGQGWTAQLMGANSVCVVCVYVCVCVCVCTCVCVCVRV